MQDKCSFCGRNRNEVNLLIAGTDGFICDECASQAYDIVQEEMKSKSTCYDLERTKSNRY